MLRVRGTLVPQAGGGGASQGERHAPAGPTPHSGLQPPLFGLIPSFITQVTTTATANIHPSAQPCSEREAVRKRPGASWYRRRKDNNRRGRVGPVRQRTNTVLIVDGGRTAEEERAAGRRTSEAWDLGPRCRLPRYSTGPRGHGASYRFCLGFPISASSDPPMQMDPAHRSPMFQQTTSVIHKVIQPSPWPRLQVPSILSLPSLSSASFNIAAPSPTCGPCSSHAAAPMLSGLPIARALFDTWRSKTSPPSIRP